MQHHQLAAGCGLRSHLCVFRRVLILCKLLILISSIMFFFSSRRRHTRYIGDWSSDVCSSDLGLAPPPTEASAAAAMQIGLGQTYRKQIVDEALERLQETLREEGLYRAEVSAEALPHRETHQMDVVVHVKPGPRARIESIQLTNDTAYRNATILSSFKMKAGQPITS